MDLRFIDSTKLKVLIIQIGKSNYSMKNLS